MKRQKGRIKEKEKLHAYFECDVVISNANLQLLLSDDIFLWPVCVVFPVMRVSFVSVRDGGETHT